MQQSSSRQSNFELMRIISMFFIVIWHIIFHTNMLNNTTGTLHYIISFIYFFIIIHVNSFIIVTGYFQYNKKENIKKALRLLGNVWFYNIVFVVIMLIFNIQSITKLEVLESTSILNINNYWFINYYIVLYLLTPFINKMISSISQKEHRKMIIILFICFSIIPAITRQRTIQNDGLTIISFMFLYLIGAYFGKYKIQDSYHFKRNSNKKNSLIFLILFIFFSCLNYVNYNFGSQLQESTNTIMNSIGNIVVENSSMFSNPIIIIQTIFYFLFFGTLKFSNKTINMISASTFGVYLIHENRYVYNNLYEHLGFSNPTNYMIIIRIIIVGLLIFSVSLIIELTRKIIFKKIGKIKVFKTIENKFDKYVNEF